MYCLTRVLSFHFGRARCACHQEAVNTLSRFNPRRKPMAWYKKIRLEHWSDGQVDRMRMPRRPAGVPAIKIAVIGHIRHPIAPPFMGGMESHCHSLVQALRRAGHEVTLFAAGESDLPNFIPICDQPYEKVLPWAEWRGTEKLSQYQERAFARAWLAVLAGDFDVVHNNSLFPKLIEWAQRDGIPMLTSLHVPPYARIAGCSSRCSGSMRTAIQCDIPKPAEFMAIPHRRCSIQYARRP